VPYLERLHLQLPALPDRVPSQGEVMPRWPDTNPTVDEDGWTHRYSTYTKDFGSFHLAITYSTNQTTDPGYIMEINGRRIRHTDNTKNTAPDFPTAKARIIDVARKWARKTLEELDAEHKKIQEKKG
jgi:hypothetical protein